VEKYRNFIRVMVFCLVIVFLFAAGGVKNAAAGLGDDFVAYYPLNGSETDRLGNPDSAYDFDGTNYESFGDILDDVFAGSGKKFTITAWIKPDEPFTSPKAGTIVAKYSDGALGEAQREILLYVRNGLLQFGWGNLTSTRWVAGSTILNPGNWYSVALVYDGSGIDALSRVKLYVNGNRETAVGTGGTTLPTVADGTAPLAIGASVNTAGTAGVYNFNGLIDEVRIYDRALSDEEIEVLSGLVAYYPFNNEFVEGDDVKTRDETGNGHDGTVNGATPTEDEGAYYFDGIGDYIEVVANGAFGFGNSTDFTLAAWIETSEDVNHYQYVVWKGNDTSDSSTPTHRTWFGLYVDPDGVLGATMAGSNITKGDTYLASDVADGKRHHIAAVYDRDGNLQLYVDGLPDPSPKPISGVPDISSDQNLFIGAYYTHRGIGHQFEGVIDDIRIYNRALSDEEIAELAALPDPDTNQPPVLDSIDIKPVNEGETLEFIVSATDPDGDSLTYSASNLPDGATFDADTHTFTWTPGYDDAVIYAGCFFEVTDGYLTDSETIIITVVDRPAQGIFGDVEGIITGLLPTGDRKTDKDIEKAAKHIKKCLDPNLWETESTLTDKGKKVFDEAKKAVKKLMKIKNPPAAVSETVSEVIDLLVYLSQELASTAIDEAISLIEDAGCSSGGNNNRGCDKTQKEIDKCQKEMAKAEAEGIKGKYDKAIDHYKKGWEHSCHAIKHAGKGGRPGKKGTSVNK